MPVSQTVASTQKNLAINMKPLNNQGAVYLILVTVVASLVIGAGVFFVSRNDKTSEPAEQNLTKTGQTANLESFVYAEVGYQCSKLIAGTYGVTTGQTGQKKNHFVPDDLEELQKFCRTTFAIEYHALIDVLRKPEVDSLISRYNTAEAWVRVLNYELIEDKDYVKRILPSYTDTNIHCIVVVHSPEGELFYLEDGDNDHVYIEVPEEEFLTSLNKASDEDVNRFWLNLR